MNALQKGLGVVPLQANGPVEFGSKLLSESRYSHIEREMLARTSTAWKNSIIILTPSPLWWNLTTNPLLRLSSESVHWASPSPSIARMMLRIRKYDAQIKYVPEEDIPVADALSLSFPVTVMQYKD